MDVYKNFFQVYYKSMEEYFLDYYEDEEKDGNPSRFTIDKYYQTVLKQLQLILMISKK